MDDKKSKIKKEDKITDELEKRILDLENQFKRAVADYRNLEKRFNEEKREVVLFANKDLLLKLLPAFDTLFLAEKHLQDEGLRISIDKLNKALKEAGVERIMTVGESFDPNNMECIGTTEGEDNKVIEETRPGFMLYNKVLWPAQVTVGKNTGNQEKKNEEIAKETIGINS